jgi:hypothetical protein
MSVSKKHCRVITNCTSRKSHRGPALSLSSADLHQPLDKVIEAWSTLLESAPREIQSGALYQGRSFSDAKAVAKEMSSHLYVISAGLGVIKSDESVPHYNLTISEGLGSIAPALSRSQSTSRDWWSLLTGPSGPAKSIRDALDWTPSTLVYVALPSTYLEMVEGDLSTLSTSQLDCVRIFTSPAGLNKLPESLRKVCMPYDDRLEGHAVYAGTRADFAQRAMRHFVEELQAQNLCLDDARAAVLQSLKTLTKPTLPERTRKTDEEIIALIAQNWGRFHGHQSHLLRYLRDEALVSCEQSRFRSLWRQTQLLSA